MVSTNQNLAERLASFNEAHEKIDVLIDMADTRQDSDALRSTRAVLEVMLVAHNWLRDMHTGKNPLGILNVENAFDQILDAIEKGMTPAA